MSIAEDSTLNSSWLLASSVGMPGDRTGLVRASNWCVLAIKDTSEGVDSSDKEREGISGNLSLALHSLGADE